MELMKFWTTYVSPSSDPKDVAVQAFKDGKCLHQAACYWLGTRSKQEYSKLPGEALSLYEKTLRQAIAASRSRIAEGLNRKTDNLAAHRWLTEVQSASVNDGVNYDATKEANGDGPLHTILFIDGGRLVYDTATDQWNEVL